MKSSTVIGIVVVIIVAVGGWYWWSMQSTTDIAPTRAIGINGSPNQGNLGGPDTGTPQTPQSY